MLGGAKPVELLEVIVEENEGEDDGSHAAPVRPKNLSAKCWCRSCDDWGCEIACPEMCAMIYIGTAVLVSVLLFAAVLYGFVHSDGGKV